MSFVAVAGTDKYGSCHDYLVWCGHTVHTQFDIENDIEWVVRTAEAIVMTPMWEHSRSAVCLKMVAEMCGKQVLYYWDQEMHGERLKEIAMPVEDEWDKWYGASNRITKVDSGSGEVRVVNLSTGGEKGRKPARFELIPPRALAQIAEVYGVGADKYADRNWERGVDWSLMFGAMMRHMWLWWAGETNDVESGLNHLGHAAFHVLGLLQLTETHPGLDDRPNLGADHG